MKTPVLVSIVVSLHVLAFGTLVFMQGCGTLSGPAAAPDAPPAPVMPPSAELGRPSELPRPMPAPRPSSPTLDDTEMMAPEAAPQTYVVRPGESLSRIAARHGVSSRELASLNKITDANKLRAGQKILLPAHARLGAAVPAPKAEKPAAKPSAKPAAAAVTAPPGGSVYVVASGDSLSKIASKHGVKVSDLKAANRLTGDMIRIGQKLAIPAGAASAPAPAPAPAAPAPAAAAPAIPAAPVAPPAPAAAPVAPPAPAPVAVPVPAALPAPEPVPAAAPAAEAASKSFPYPLSESETLESVARTFGVSVNDLMRLNNLTDPAQVKPGMKLLIPLSN